MRKQRPRSVASQVSGGNGARAGLVWRARPSGTESIYKIIGKLKRQSHLNAIVSQAEGKIVARLNFI